MPADSSDSTYNPTGELRERKRSIDPLDSALSAFIQEECRVVDAGAPNGGSSCVVEKKSCKRARPISSRTFEISAPLLVMVSEPVRVNVGGESRINIDPSTPILLPQGAKVRFLCRGTDYGDGYIFPMGGKIKVNECKLPAHFRFSASEQDSWLTLTLPRGTVMRVVAEGEYQDFEEERISAVG